ncbi:MAG: glycoside hydrolase family 95 protein [Lentisphaerae bacterium]|nr:glycoside hydrolase family 95 protein [Lentisphaerota bacterium]
MGHDKRLWYTQPASDWLAGLPVGTGRLAAMVLGTVPVERIALNHEWLWRGLNRERENRDVAARLPAVRDLLLDGDYERGTVEGNRAFACHAEERVPSRVDSYEPIGDLFIDVLHSATYGYQRQLDLSTGIVSVTFKSVNNPRPLFRRDVLAHLGLDLLFVRLTCASQVDGAVMPFTCRLSLDRRADPDCELERTVMTDRLCLVGAFRDGISFAAGARVFARGRTAEVREEGERLLVKEADELIVAVDAGTSDSGDAACATLAALTDPVWSELVDDHCAEFARHGATFSLELPLEDPDLPTDERMRLLREGHADPGLALLYYELGRYLLIASSANGQLPANLQGKWNEDIDPPWNCDYHHDVNLQMNYWPAENGGMQESVDALLQHIERFVPHAKTAARDLYGCDGVWFPIQTDAWGRSTPESFGWAVWVGAAPWLAQHMWWHYEFSLDKTFLRERAYPFMKCVAAFFEDYLIRGADGRLLCVPSQSPENRFNGGAETSFPVSLCVNAAMDLELIWDVLTHLVQACRALGIDRADQERWQGMLDALPKPQIGSDGRLLEWNEEFAETEPGHRHLSHLYGLFPGEQFCPFRRPELYRAAERSLEGRMAASGGHTGWSRAWVACLFARLGRGEEAFEHLQHLVTDFASDSLLDLHPPRIFQIEGNLGGAAAVHEMLLQSYYAELNLLPALPSAWSSGSVRGLRGRGGFVVDIRWEAGRLVEACVVSTAGAVCRIVDPDDELSVVGPNGGALETVRDVWCQTLETSPGMRFRVRPVCRAG